VKIVFMHYHAKRGGITRVIQQQMEALRDDAECLFLAGDAGDGDTRPEPGVIPGLAYDGLRGPGGPRETAEAILRAITAKWPSGCDILHVHNPLLRKNSDFLAILCILTRRGLKLFLQVHDAAEDLRPQSYYREEEYPEDCHYGVINSRDHRVFLEAGLRPEGLHRVYNMVRPLPRGGGPEEGGARRLLLYAVRAIRRKNLGEALLLSRFLPPGYRVGLTLPPTSPADQPAYREWRTFAASEGLAADFELGLSHSLGDLVARSALMITTSVREGFGFSFLEPWTADRAVVGRRIEAVAPDFEAAGVDLSSLYPEIRVPLDLIDPDRLRRVWVETAASLCGEFGREPPFDTGSAWDGITSGGMIDFAFLDAAEARGLISLCGKNGAVRSRLTGANPFLPGLLDPMSDDELIQRNRKAVSRSFGLRSYRDTLLDVYRKVSTVQVSQRIDRKKLLMSFLRPGNFLLGGI